MHCPTITAHRGGARHAPENTLEAFAMAAEHGAGWVEADVSLLGDGTAILFHDADFFRCAGSLMTVRESDWATARQLTLGTDRTPARIPTLADGLSRAQALGLGINLELKCHGDERLALTEAVLQAVDADGPGHDRLLLSSFDYSMLARIRRARPDMPLACLCADLPSDWLGIAAALTPISFNVDYQATSDASVAAATAAGLEVHAYTPNQPSDVERLWQAGLSGVITDDVPAFMAAPPYA